jgi:hypothetical protein
VGWRRRSLRRGRNMGRAQREQNSSARSPSGRWASPSMAISSTSRPDSSSA